MARFYLTGRNGRGGFFKEGGISSIESTHTRGWTAGVEVECFPLEDGTDRLDIYMTPGSSGSGHRVLIGQVLSNGAKSPKWKPAKGRKSTQGTV